MAYDPFAERAQRYAREYGQRPPHDAIAGTLIPKVEQEAAAARVVIRRAGVLALARLRQRVALGEFSVGVPVMDDVAALVALHDLRAASPQTDRTT